LGTQAKILGLLGQGSSSVAYAGTVGGVPVVVKKYREGKNKKFQQERLILNSLNMNMDGLCTILGSSGDNTLILSPVCRHFGKETSAKTSRPTLNQLEDLIDIISELHKNGVVHRDLKLSNIYFAEDGSVRLNDFGVAVQIVPNMQKIIYEGDILRAPDRLLAGLSQNPYFTYIPTSQDDLESLAKLLYSIVYPQDFQKLSSRDFTGIQQYWNDCMKNVGFQKLMNHVRSADPMSGLKKWIRNYYQASIKKDVVTNCTICSFPFLNKDDVCPVCFSSRKDEVQSSSHMATRSKKAENIEKSSDDLFGITRFLSTQQELSPNFAHPVELTQYKAIIQDPIDLATIKEKYQSGQYEHLDALEMDFVKMVDNSNTFNGKNHAVTREARLICNKWKRIRSDIERDLNNVKEFIKRWLGSFLPTVDILLILDYANIIGLVSQSAF